MGRGGGLCFTWHQRMAWTKRQFISKAYASIGLSNYLFDLEPEELEEAVITLDAMMGAWNAQGIRIGYPISASPDDIDIDQQTSCPDSANLAIYANLALILAGEAGKQPSAFIATAASTGLTALLSSLVAAVPVQQPGWLPAGQGNRRCDRRRVFLDEPAEKLDTGFDGTIDDLEI